MLPLNKHTVQITIIDESTGEKCDAHCGVDWSSPEAIALATKRIKDRFGDQVQLEYIDLAKPTTNHYASELEQRIRDKNFTLPLLVINGQPKISGQFDIHLLLDAIEAEMETKPQLREVG